MGRRWRGSERGDETVEEHEHDDEDAAQELGIAEPLVRLAGFLESHLVVEGLPIDSSKILSFPAIVSLKSASQVDRRNGSSRFPPLLHLAPAHASPVVVLVLDHRLLVVVPELVIVIPLNLVPLLDALLGARGLRSRDVEGGRLLQHDSHLALGHYHLLLYGSCRRRPHDRQIVEHVSNPIRHDAKFGRIAQS